MAAATAIITAGVGLASAGASFAQAAKQNRLQKEAAESAAKYMEDAKKKFEVNYLESLQVPLEGYETAARVNQAAGAQSLEAMRETGQRAVLGGVGRLQEQMQLGGENLRTNMQKDLYERDKMIASEEGRLRDVLGDIDIGTAQGAQRAAADASDRKAEAITGGFQALGGVASSLYEGSDLYKSGTRGDVMAKYGTGLDQAGMVKANDALSKLSKDQLKELNEQGSKSSLYQSIFPK